MFEFLGIDPSGLGIQFDARHDASCWAAAREHLGGRDGRPTST